MERRSEKRNGGKNALEEGKGLGMLVHGHTEEYALVLR